MAPPADRRYARSAVILNFRGSIWESLQRGMVSAAVVVAATRSASDSNFRSGKEEWFRLQTATTPRMHQFVISGLDFRINAGFCPETAQWLHRFLISGSDLRITVEGVGCME